MTHISELLKFLQQEDGVVYSYFLLGFLYEKGVLVSQDRGKAFAYYTQAACMDVPEYDDQEMAMRYKITAAYNVLIMHFRGHGDLIDKRVSACIEVADKFGGADVLYGLGVMYEHGIIFPRDYAKAINCYNLACNQKHAKAISRLAAMYANGLGVTKDDQKAQELFKTANELGCEDAKFYLQRKQILRIWPNEDWLPRDECGASGEVYEATSGMSNLPAVLSIFAKRAAKRQDFSIERDCRDLNQIDPNILLWLQTVSRCHVGKGAYAVAKSALSAIGARNGLMIKVVFSVPWSENPAKHFAFRWFAPDIARGIASYVRMYVRAKAWLQRAGKAGVMPTEEDWACLAPHKANVEVSCKDMYDEYMQKVAEDDQLWDKVFAMLAADRRFRTQPRNKLFTLPLQDFQAQITKSIAESNIDEYMIWTSLILDEARLRELHKRFFNQAVKEKHLELASEFLNEYEFDVNYILEDISMSPLELMITEFNPAEVRTLLARDDVDVNFNSPIFTAVISGAEFAVKLLLGHPDIDIDVKKEVNGRQVTLEEAAVLHKHDMLVPIIKKHREEKARLANETALSLYFQYRSPRSQVQASASHQQPARFSQWAKKKVG